MKIDGKKIANKILIRLKNIITTLPDNKKNPKPCLTVIILGSNPESLSFVKQKQKSIEAIGATIKIVSYSKNLSQEFLIKNLNILNSDNNIHGIIIQKPLPSQINNTTINQSINPKKDIDGFGNSSKFFSPVSLAVFQALYYCYCKITCHWKQNKTSWNDAIPNNNGEILKNFNISNSLQISNFKLQIFLDWLNSQKIVLLGRGETGGKPIAKTMNRLKVNYIQSHSKTKNKENLLKKADIIISAVGKPGLITGNMIKKNAICLGVGIKRKKEQATEISLRQSNFIGDFEEKSIAQKALFYTPTPGGIGPLTVANLLNNLFSAYLSAKYAEKS